MQYFIQKDEMVLKSVKAFEFNKILGDKGVHFNFFDSDRSFIQK